MKNIAKVADKVEMVLKHIPESRNSDDRLYYWVCMSYNREIGNKSFMDVMRNRKEYGVPKFETVRRARQKIQAQGKYEADEAVTEGRYENFKTVRAFV